MEGTLDDVGKELQQALLEGGVALQIAMEKLLNWPAPRPVEMADWERKLGETLLALAHMSGRLAQITGVNGPIASRSVVRRMAIQKRDEDGKT